MCCIDELKGRYGRCSYCLFPQQALTRSPLDICHRCSDALGPRDRRKLGEVRCIEATGILVLGKQVSRRGTVRLLLHRRWIVEHEDEHRLTKAGRLIARRQGYMR